MRFPGSSALALVLLSTLALSACSGGEAEPGESAGESRATGGAGDSEQKIRSCKVTTELTGAETLTVAGKGRVVVGGGAGPDAFYEFANDAMDLTAYSAGEDFTPSVTLAVGKTTYSTLSETAGLEIGRDGKHASVDAEASGGAPQEKQVRIKAEFTC